MAILPGSAEGLNAFLESLDDGDPMTSRHLVLSTFQGLHSRILVEKGQQKTVGRSKGKGKATATEVETNVPDVEDDEPNEPEDDQYEEDSSGPNALDDPTALDAVIDRFELLIPPDSFSMIFIDEGHRVKNPISKQTIALWLLVGKYVLMTATPSKASLLDLFGILRFGFKALQAKGEISTEPLTHQAYKSLYATFRDEYDHDLFAIPSEQRLDYLRALNPAGFRKLCRSERDARNVTNGTDILPLIMSLFMLRRSKGDTITAADQEVVIGSEIPPYQIINVELGMGPQQAMLYRGVEENVRQVEQQFRDALATGEALEKKLAKQAARKQRKKRKNDSSSSSSSSESDVNESDSDNDSPTAGKTKTDAEKPTEEVKLDDDETREALKRRRLAIASFNPRLDAFESRKIGCNAQTAHHRANAGTDSFDFIYNWTHDDFDVAPPNNRLDMAHYLSATSVKTQAVLAIIKHHLFDCDEKVIVWATEPPVLMQLEILLKILHIETVVIRAGKKNSERVQAEVDFNTNPKVKVILLSV
ncbi:hypothetical protein M409DRAFT_31203, partial [Zasmidium cellare ATCC 36951]